MTALSLASSSLSGTRIRLDRPSDREYGCCGNIAVITAGNLPHNAALVCATCGRHRGWLSEPVIAFIQETRARFGAPQVITLRT